ncbi:MAG: hypothetical protein PHX38_03450 [Sulfuricella sp.]|nr:hypothetical protein [Sulfuricella sp.]
MKKPFFLLAAAMLAGIIGTAPGMADDVDSQKGERIAEVYNDLQLPGTIETIDYKSGRLTLNSDLGKVNLNFPPEALRGLQSGDPVVVDLGFSQQGRSIGRNRVTEVMETFNELQVTGTVRNVDYRTGTLTLNTRAGDIALNFPPPAVKDLKRGDTVTVNMGYSKQGRTIQKK